ncbi:hypothetical protein ACPOL_7115 (plasmid) [Acidisarcina polymorpha]|uniref:Uncharacterized protein n=1 Tax=Acidisarcina polymorpha TaxID=2211140 RepID=A0A2Z5GBZ3_9BACT|nr:hypothetical protein ACPOL_7115 [Acidisarcina polymorpha]
MCNRATAGLVRRYWGLSNWIAYCREWGMEAPTISSIMRPF